MIDQLSAAYRLITASTKKLIRSRDIVFEGSKRDIDVNDFAVEYRRENR